MQNTQQLFKYIIAFTARFKFDVWWKAKCHLHLSQAIEGKEGMSLDLCDIVALGNLTAAQRSVNRLTRAAKQMTLKTPCTSWW